MEYKVVQFETKDVDEETGIFEGYAATFSNVPDSYGDIIDKGAFKKTLKEGGARIKILWNHLVNEPIGKPIEMYEDEKGLYIKGKLTLGVQRAKEVLALMKDGVINEMSIGYDTITEAWEKQIRHLKEVRLWDTSPVTFAANPEAVITGVKSDLEHWLKAGRVLVNKDKVKAALDALQALLDAAGDEEPEKSTPGPTEEKEAAALDELLSTRVEDFDIKAIEAEIDSLLAISK